MPKVAFTTTMEGIRWGGSEELWSQTALLLAKQGHEVVVNVQWWPDPARRVKDLQEAGCRMEFRHLERPGIMQRIVKKAAHKAGVKEENWLDRQKPDLLVISQGDTYQGVASAEQCRQRKIPYVLIAQAASEHWWPEDAVASQAAKCYQDAAAVYFVSGRNLSLVSTQLAVPFTNASVVRNPFNVAYDTSLAWPEPQEGLRFACVGRLEPSAKGQDILFEVLRQEKWQTRPLSVTLFGDGPNRHVLEKLQQQYGLKNVNFGGFVEDITEVWRNHHALVLASRYEGLPLAVVEAMLCSRPAIVTDVAGNSELVKEGVTGFLADYPAPHSLDAAMERAWQSRQNLQSIGLVAGDRVRQLIPRDPTAVFGSQLLTLIDSLANRA